MTEQVLFHYTLSGQSLILPLCSSVMLFISVVCTGGFHIAGFPSLDLNQLNLTEFRQYYVSNVLQTVELLPSFFLNNCESYLCCVFIVKPIFQCEIF